jgi:hypothetical protein
MAILIGVVLFIIGVTFYKSDEDYDDFSFFKIWGGILSTVGFLFTMYGYKSYNNFSRKISL